MRQSIAQKAHIKNYMREHFESWVQLATSSDTSLGWGDILFIHETFKAVQWGLAVLNEPGQTISCNLNLDWAHPNPFIGAVIPPGECTYGPITDWIGRPITPNNAAHGDDVADQCLFVHYYKMRGRGNTSQIIEAAAGPHELPPGPRGGEPSATSAKVCSLRTPLLYIAHSSW